MRTSAAITGLVAGFLATAEAAESTLDIQGGQRFDEVVTGHKITEKTPDGVVAYLVLDDASANFRAAVEQVIRQGNTLNKIGSDGKIWFRIGCEERGVVVNDGFSLTMEEQLAIAESTRLHPLSVVLRFDTTPGAGISECLSHADEIDLLPPPPKAKDQV